MKNLYPGKIFRNYTKPARRQALNGRIFPAVIFIYLPLTAISLLQANSGFTQAGIAAFTAQHNSALSGRTYTGPGGGIAAETEYQPASGNTFTYNFGTASGLTSGTASVNGYMTGTSAFTIIENVVTSVVMRRVDNAVVTGNRDILFFSGTRTPGPNTGTYTAAALTLNLNAAYTDDMSVAFSQNNLLIGTDNIFSNQGNSNGNNNNIERVDVMIGNGYRIKNAQRYGFPILERGVYGVHDGFKIAVITALDASGNPSAYSNVVAASSTSYNNTNFTNPIADGTYAYFLFRRQGTADLEINQQTSSQGIGGVAFRFSDFGLADSAVIYGYSILPNDFNSTTGSDALDYTNTTHFPTNTSESIGGLDILAVLGIAMETDVLPVGLTNFTAIEKAGTSLLEWTTMTEIDNKGFYIERSNNGRDWTAIDFIFSKAPEGNSHLPQKYTYTDFQPFSGTNYYRLRQTDHEGKQDLSDTRILRLASRAATVTIFPNPAAGTTYVRDVKPGTQLLLIDAKGAVVERLIAKNSVEPINMGRLTNGIYFLQIKEPDKLPTTLRLVKR